MEQGAEEQLCRTAMLPDECSIQILVGIEIAVILLTSRNVH
jgi:hypothetical protein